jgi:hypothetical protein
MIVGLCLRLAKTLPLVVSARMSHKQQSGPMNSLKTCRGFVVIDSSVYAGALDDMTGR